MTSQPNSLICHWAGLLMLVSKGMEKNKIRLNPGFSKIMRFMSKIAPDFVTHQWGKTMMKRMNNEN